MPEVCDWRAFYADRANPQILFGALGKSKNLSFSEMPKNPSHHREGRWVAPDKSAEQNLTLFENGEFLTLFLTMLPKNTYFEVQKSVTIPYQQVL